MSLNWNLNRVKDFRDVCYERLTSAEVEAMGTTIEELVGAGGSSWYIPGGSEVEQIGNCAVVERMTPLTNCFIWATMGAGMGSITEENYSEFWLRVNLQEKLSGPFLGQKRAEGEGLEPRFITLEEVKAHIGLGTNVSYESWSSWTKRQVDSWRINVLRGQKMNPGPWQAPVSQVAKDTGEQIERLAEALRNAEIYGSAEIETLGEKQVEADLERVYRMEHDVRCIESDWSHIIEHAIREAEEAEGEE